MRIDCFAREKVYIQRDYIELVSALYWFVSLCSLTAIHSLPLPFSPHDALTLTPAGSLFSLPIFLFFIVI